MTPHAPDPMPVRSVPVYLRALAAHLDTYGLPEPASVAVYRDRDAIDCQPWHHAPAELATELLAWLDSLTEPSIELRRLAPQRVHINIIGTLDSGHEMTVYVSAPDSLTHHYLDPVVPHRRALLAPAALRAWAITESGVSA